VHRPETSADAQALNHDSLIGQRKLAGDEGVWFFISADITMFAVFFLLFMLERYKAVELFEQSRRHLDPLLGALNTLILLSSSWLVALAVHSARAGRRQAVNRYLTLGMLVGAGFAVSKIFEYWLKISAGITMMTNDFFMFYFALTGLHFLHFLVGMVVLAVCLAKSRSDALDEHFIVWIESSGCYWHMVDLLWIVLFPMLYLLHAP
jgi:nitric oxide reductase NorE protein